MDKLTADEIAEFKEIFSLVDVDGGGTISKVELSELMATLGIEATSAEIDLMIKEIDEDGKRRESDESDVDHAGTSAAS